MKKVLYPIVYVVLAMVPMTIFSKIFNYLVETTNADYLKAIVRANLVITVLGLIVPIFLFVVFYPLRNRYPLLIFVPVFGATGSIINWLYTYATHMTYTMAIPMLLAGISFAIGIAGLVVVVLTALSISNNQRLKTGLGILAVFQAVGILFFNRFVSRLIINLFARADLLTVYSILSVTLSFLATLVTAFVIYELYREEELLLFQQSSYVEPSTFDPETEHLQKDNKSLNLE